MSPHKRKCGWCWANLEGSVGEMRSLLSLREAERVPASIRWESLAEIGVNCSLDQRNCFSELWCVLCVFFKTSFQLLLKYGALLATDTSNCLRNLNWTKVSNFHLVVVYISVDSASVELGLSKMCLQCHYS